MHSIKSSKTFLLALPVVLTLAIYAANATPSIKSDIEAIQEEVKNAQKALGQVRKTKGKSTADFDASMRKIRLRIDNLDDLIKESKTRNIPLGDLAKKASRLNEHLSSLQKARGNSEWRTVERDLQRMNSSLKDLHSAALKIPGAQGTASRTPPKPPTGKTGGPSGPDRIQKTGPGYKPPAAVPRKPQPPTAPDSNPKGPDDPRFAAAPPPAVPPEPPPPPPDDGKRYRASSSTLEKSRGLVNSNRERNPAQPPVSIREIFPKPKPITLRNGTKIFFSSGHSLIQKRTPITLPDKLITTPPGKLSRAQISEAIRRIQRTYNVTPRSTTGGIESSSSHEPVITLSPMQSRCRYANVGNTSFGYHESFYELEKGDHYPWAEDQTGGWPGGTIVEKKQDRIYCKNESDLPIDSFSSEVIIPLVNSSQIIFHLYLRPDKIYLADIATGGKKVLNGEIVEAENGHILYVFTAADLSHYQLFMYCLSDHDGRYSEFQGIDIYQVD